MDSRSLKDSNDTKFVIFGQAEHFIMILQVLHTFWNLKVEFESGFDSNWLGRPRGSISLVDTDSVWDVTWAVGSA
jgi:hypothetical protein